MSPPTVGGGFHGRPRRLTRLVHVAHFGVASFGVPVPAGGVGGTLGKRSAGIEKRRVSEFNLFMSLKREAAPTPTAPAAAPAKKG